jgi:hypothetical protein
MSYLAYFRGIGIGLLLAAGCMVATKPAPVLHIDANELTSSESDVVKKSYPYSRFNKLPRVSFDGGSGVVLHHNVERVSLNTGQPGVEVIILKKKNTRKTYAI